MIIQINSSNKRSSYILNKNPSSGLTIKGLRKGFIFGKFVGALSYVCGFEEGVNQDSFEKEDNYLIYKGYCSAEAALNVLTNLFDCVTKDNNKQYEDSLSLNTITIKCIEANEKNLFTFNSEAIKLSWANVADDCNLIQLDISNKGSLIDLIRYTCLFLYMQVVNNNTGFLQIDQARLYANIIKKDDSIPFIIRHRFRGILEQNIAKKIVPMLNNESVKLCNIGRNENQRMAFVSQHIKYKNVLDIGCGHGKFIKTSKATKYIGVDIDEKALERAKVKAGYVNIEASFYTDWQEGIEQLTEPTTVLLIEFIEHVERELANKILIGLIQNRYVNQILISTPNKNFNKYFNILDSNVRFEDHIYELTEKEFKEQIPGDDINWGDSVDNCFMTLYKNIEFGDNLIY